MFLVQRSNLFNKLLPPLQVVPLALVLAAFFNSTSFFKYHYSNSSKLNPVPITRWHLLLRGTAEFKIKEWNTSAPRNCQWQ